MPDIFVSTAVVFAQLLKLGLHNGTRPDNLDAGLLMKQRPQPHLQDLPALTGQRWNTTRDRKSYEQSTKRKTGMIHVTIDYQQNLRAHCYQSGVFPRIKQHPAWQAPRSLQPKKLWEPADQRDNRLPRHHCTCTRLVIVWAAALESQAAASYSRCGRCRDLQASSFALCGLGYGNLVQEFSVWFVCCNHFKCVKNTLRVWSKKTVIDIFACVSVWIDFILAAYRFLLNQSL